MLSIEAVDPAARRQVQRFIRLPHRLYARHPYWVPLLDVDARMYLNRKDFPFYAHSEAEFFLAVRAGRDVGRLAVLEHRLFNAQHQTRQAQFHFFDCDHDLEAAAALFERAATWATARWLDTLVGPKGFGVLDGYGILIQGFDQRQLMSSTNYNYPYYGPLLEAAGFVKEMDFVSARTAITGHTLPDWLHRLARQVQQREALRVETYASLPAVVAAGQQIFAAYNGSFTANWEYYPIPAREVEFTINNLKPIANPRLFKVIFHEADMVGFLFGVPDVSPALQRSRGRLTPWSILDLLWEKYRTRTVVVVGMGLLEPYRLRGAGALLIAETEKTLRELTVQHVGYVNNADSAVRMRQDLKALGLPPTMVHRVYRKALR